MSETTTLITVAPFDAPAEERLRIALAPAGALTHVYFDGVSVEGIARVLLRVEGNARTMFEIFMLKTKTQEPLQDFISYAERCGIAVHVRDVAPEFTREAFDMARAYVPKNDPFVAFVHRECAVVMLASTDLRVRCAVLTPDYARVIGCATVSLYEAMRDEKLYTLMLERVDDLVTKWRAGEITDLTPVEQWRS